MQRVDHAEAPEGGEGGDNLFCAATTSASSGLFLGGGHSTETHKAPPLHHHGTMIF